MFSLLLKELNFWILFGLGMYRVEDEDRRLGTRKTGLSPPVFLYWRFQGGTSIVVP